MKRTDPKALADALAEVDRLRQENAYLRGQVAILQQAQATPPAQPTHGPAWVTPTWASEPAGPIYATVGTLHNGHPGLDLGGVIRSGELSFNPDGSQTWKDDNGTVTHAPYDPTLLPRTTGCAGLFPYGVTISPAPVPCGAPTGSPPAWR